MQNYLFDASVNRILLLLGMIHIDDVIAWADQEIEASDIPPSSLIEVSMGYEMTTNEMAEQLLDLVNLNDIKPLLSVFVIVAEQIRSNQLDIQKAITKIYSYLRSENLLYEEPFTIFHNLESDLSLIRDGIFHETKMDDLRGDLLESLDDITNLTPDSSAP